MKGFWHTLCIKMYISYSNYIIYRTLKWKVRIMFYSVRGVRPRVQCKTLLDFNTISILTIVLHIFLCNGEHVLVLVNHSPTRCPAIAQRRFPPLRAYSILRSSRFVTTGLSSALELFLSHSLQFTVIIMNSITCVRTRIAMRTCLHLLVM